MDEHWSLGVQAISAGLRPSTARIMEL